MEKPVKLFEAGKIGNMEVKNRIIMAPMGGMSYVTEPDGYVTDGLIAFYEARAKGGAGFIQLSNRVVGGNTFQAPEHLVKAYTGPLYNPGLLSLEDDDHVISARRFTAAIHAQGTKVGFSVAHFGVMLARALRARPAEARPDLVRVVAPSAVRDPFSGRTPEPLTIAEIEELVEVLAQGTKRGMDAGFDAVRIQGGHGYLVHQFLSPRTNRRKDRYGGSLKNRCRFACEIIRKVRAAAGPDFPVILRMNGSDFLEGGITEKEALQQASLFVEAGANALDISAAPVETRYRGVPTLYQPSGAIVYLAGAIKKTVGVPIITTGKIGPILAERILQEGSADFVQMGRALVADPDLPNKAKKGKLDAIRPCIYCNDCLERQGLPSAQNARHCSVNPGVGREMDYKPEPAQHARKVMVVGGGPAGMEAARVAAERGHDTSLYEKLDRLGGQWNAASVFRPELGDLTNYLSRGLESSGVKVILNQAVTPQLIERVKPDAVVVATGATPVLPEIPGVHAKNVVSASAILTGRVEAGNEIVVVGGRTVGLNVAIYLAEQGKQVSIVTRSKIARGISHTKKNAIMELLINYRVCLYPNCALDSITPKGVNVMWDSSDPAMKQGEKFEFLFLKADTVVLALGANRDNRLFQQISGYFPEVFAIGDCVEPRSVFDAIHEGSRVGRTV